MLSEHKTKLSRNDEAFNVAVTWMRNMGTDVPRTQWNRLVDLIVSHFEITRPELLAEVEGIQLSKNGFREKKFHGTDEEFGKLLPGTGWFKYYREYTRMTESPLTYHIFSSLCVLGASLGRRVFLDMGFFKVFPNYTCVLVGPTGLVKKTSAIDIAKELIHNLALCPIMTEQVTPSALITALTQSGHHFIYVPEMSNFFDKAKYNDGLVTRIIRLLDCPEEYSVRTQARKVETILGPALTVLGGTTPDQIVTAMPREIINSGFLNRFIWIQEDDTDRCFPRPERGTYLGEIQEIVVRLKAFSGSAVLTPEAVKVYEDWYKKRRDQLRGTTDEFVHRSMQRGDIHMLKTALVINAAYEDDPLRVSEFSISLAIKMIDFVESRLPKLVRSVTQSAVSADVDQIVGVLRRMGGAADHSTLLRRLSGKFSASVFKQHMKTLIEADVVVQSTKKNALYYILQEDK